MENKDLYRNLFRASSLLTDRYPQAGAHLLDWSIKRLIGNSSLVRTKISRDIDRLGKIKDFRRILVISDLNIGDAVFSQASVTALRDFFPEAEINLVVGAAARNLIQGNPGIDNLLPDFEGAPFPTKSDFETVRRICLSRPYDIIFTFSPFFQSKKHFPDSKKVVDYTTLAAMLIHGERSEHEKNHVMFQTYRFVHDLFSGFTVPKTENDFRGVTVTLSDRAIAEAENFLTAQNLLGGEPLILHNPDASTRFTKVPLQVQIAILKRLATLPCRILLGAGHTDRGIEQRMLSRLTSSERERVIVVPASVPIDAYAALIDFADLYITGDAGPLHIAAARKRSRSGRHKFRNRTSVFSIFGATPARMYGYESRYPEFLAANQDAPSHTYISESPCRNITCINKMAKTCKTLRCFESVDIEGIVSDSSRILESGMARGISLAAEVDKRPAWSGSK